MDRSSSIGFMLIMVIFLGWYFFFLQPTQEQEKPKTPTDTLTQQTVVTAPEPVLSSTQQDSLNLLKMGDFHLAASGENKTIAIKTDKMSVTIETKGGVISQLLLNEHLDEKNQILPIIKANKDNHFYETLALQNNKEIRTDELYFTPIGNVPSNLTGKDSATLTLRAAIDANRYIEKIYTLKGNTYDVHYGFNIIGLGSDLKDDFYRINWESALPTTEKSVKTQKQKSTIVYALADDVKKMSYGETEQEDAEGAVNWISFRSQFFSNALIGDKPFQKVSLKYTTPTEDSINKVMETAFSVEAKKSNDIRNGFTMYAGPLEFDILKSYKVELHKQMDLGWWVVKYINAAAIWVFKKLESFSISYGLIIFIFAVLIKLLVFPMTYKSFISMAKLKVLNQMPEMKELEEKYKDDAQKLQVEKMGIYSKMGVSPFGGCLPLILQYPVTISMFFFFPQAVELRHKAFLWADDLSTYDSIMTLPFHIPAYGDHVSLFTILMAISTFLFTYYNQSSQPTSDNPAMQMQMKIITYVMPFFLLFLLNNYASGLSWYYFISNLLAVSQTLAFRYFIDDKKLEAQLHEARINKSKSATGAANNGKSKLEQWMEKQQNKQKEIAEQQKKEQGAKGKDKKK